MQIYVIDPYQTAEPHFPIVGMVKSYNSLLWNVQLFGLGYFEMTLPANPESVHLLEEGRMVVRESDIVNTGSTIEYKNAMIIRRVAIQYDADYGYTLHVSGKSIKDILSQRIIWEPVDYDDTSLDAVMAILIRMNASDPVNYAANFLRIARTEQTGAENWKNAATTQLATAEADLQQARVDYDQAVAQYGEDSPEAEAAKEFLEAAEEDVAEAEQNLADAQAALDVADKKVNYYMQLSSVAEFRKIPYFEDQSIPLTNPPEISVQLYGENLGAWCENIATEYGLGWDIQLTENNMYFVFVKGVDRHSTVVFSPDLDNLKNAEYVRDLSVYRNSGLAVGEGQGIDQIRVYLDGGENERRYEEFIDTGLTKNEGTSDLVYQKMVRQAGKSVITKLNHRESISGEIDTDGVYKIGEDFNLGDVVAVKLDQGISATTRLIEIIYADEASGTSVTGTFEEWEVS